MSRVLAADPVGPNDAAAAASSFNGGVLLSSHVDNNPDKNAFSDTDMFASMVSGSLETRVVELKSALNEANVTIDELRRRLDIAESRQKSLSLSVTALRGARDRAEAAALASTAELEQLRPLIPGGNDDASVSQRVEELERKLQSSEAIHRICLNAVKQRAEEAERRVEKAELLAASAGKQTDIVGEVAADEIATNDALLAVIGRCVDALRPVMVEEEIALMERSPADRNQMLPAAISMLGKLWETSDEQRLDARAQCEQARALLEKSEAACDQLQAQIDDQAAVIEKLKEITTRGSAQYAAVVADNVKLAEALGELAPLAEHCRVMTDENARLKALHAETKEQVTASTVNIAAKEEIVRKRMEALDNVPTEQLYIEYLERKSGTEQKKVALLLSTLVSKVRLLTSEVVQLRERNLGLMHVILEDAREDKQRCADVEYLATCLAWKDAMDERVRWDGQFHHEMEERALLSAGRGSSAGAPDAESVIMAAAGNSNGFKQKVIADSGPSSVREEFNKVTKRAAAAKASADRHKAISKMEAHRADAALKELAALKLENVRLAKLLEMPASERADIMGLASAPNAVKCDHCVGLLRVNQDLVSYRRMEDARHADSANRLKELAKERDDKMTDLKQAHRMEIQELNARHRESANIASTAAASMKKQISELEARIEVEKKRTDARIARSVPYHQQQQPQEEEFPLHRHQTVMARAATVTVEEPLCKKVARQVALSVLNQTWRSMQHSPEEGARLSVLLRDDQQVERALNMKMAKRDQTLGDYVIQIAKQCIKVNDAFSKQTEKEKQDTTRLLYELVNDSKTVIANVLSKVAPSNLPDVAGLRSLIEQSEQHFGDEQHRAVLFTSFDTCAKYIESIVEWIETEKHQTPDPRHDKQDHDNQDHDNQDHRDKQQQHLSHEQNREEEDEQQQQRDDESGKRLARGSLGHDRKKMHKSTGEYDN